MKNIAFIGLGNMGGPMALNLLKAGHKVTGFDLSQEALHNLKNVGGAIASNAAEASQNADVVITMLPSGKHALEVLTESFLKNLKPNTLIIESSTIEADVAREIAELAQKHHHMMIDAPVSGGTIGAANATLTFMVGGSKEALTRATPYLECMGKNIFHAGESGAGQVAKICNNMLLAIQMIGTSEAINLGISHGLDPKVLSEIMQKSSGKNWTLEVYNPHPHVMENVPASRDYTGGFAVDLMTKDLTLAMQAGINTGSPTPLGAMARNFYKMWAVAGNGRLDFSSIIRFLANK